MVKNINSEKDYTHDWISSFQSNTDKLKNLNLCLEIGVFEGRTSNYIVENIISKDGKLICVDPLTDSYLNDELTELDIERNISHFSCFRGQYERFLNNVEEHLLSGKIELVKKLSVDAFPELLQKYKNQIDFIYVDGDHRAKGVYIDAVNSFQLCKSGGYILFDDYLWEVNYPENTKSGIDKFLKEYIGNYTMIVNNNQVMIQKN